MNISIILSTYNNLAFLQKTLWGLACQTDPCFEIVLADDGSDQSTRSLVEGFAESTSIQVVHLWHEDQGFRKQRILNQAILRASGEYLVFVDGDIIPRDDFVAAHRALARRGWYVSGGSHINLPASIHARIDQKAIEQQSVFDPRWLREQGMDSGRYRYRLTRNRWLAECLNRMTPRAGIFVGSNASAWREDLLAVDGFDETFGYGGDDKELGIRLTNHGIRSRRMKYSLVCLHLDHPRGYLSEERLRANRQRIRQLRRDRVVRPERGISDLLEK